MNMLIYRQKTSYHLTWLALVKVKKVTSLAGRGYFFIAVITIAMIDKTIIRIS